MKGLFIFAGAFFLLFSCLAIGIGTGPAQAIIYDFTATFVEGSSPVSSNFTLKYNDLNGNERFSIDELVADSFSGVNYPFGYYTNLTGIPEYDIVSSPLTEGGVDNRWTFTIPNLSSVSTPSVNWIYSQTSSVVPVPPTALLMGAGLLGLVGWRRFRKN